MASILCPTLYFSAPFFYCLHANATAKVCIQCEIIQSCRTVFKYACAEYFYYAGTLNVLSKIQIAF